MNKIEEKLRTVTTQMLSIDGGKMDLKASFFSMGANEYDLADIFYELVNTFDVKLSHRMIDNFNGLTGQRLIEIIEKEMARNK